MRRQRLRRTIVDAQHLTDSAFFLLATSGVSSLNRETTRLVPRELLVVKSVVPCMNLSAFDPAHWRRRAKECRKVAEQLDDAGRPMMLEIAQLYDGLAQLTESKGWSAPRVKPSFR